MMASIPNMRSTPLPVPSAKIAAETAPGDFAGQMPAAPAVPGQPGDGAPPELVIPRLQIAEEPAEGEAGDTPETKAEAPQGDRPAPPETVIPFLPVQPGIPVPQAKSPVSAEAPLPSQAGEVPKVRSGRRSCGTDGNAGLPVPALAGEARDEAPPADASRIEAAVKELLQRKQVLAKPVTAAPDAKAADAAKAEAAPAQVPAQVAPAPVQAPASPQAPLPAIDQIQTLAAPTAPQLMPARAGSAGPADGMRNADLAVERQLDLARDSEWLDRLARDIARAGASDTPLRFRLHPQTLGSLHVELQQGDRGTAVRLTVETEAARQLLADAQPRLAAEARAQGVRIAETHVDLSSFGRHAPGEQRRQDEAHQTPFVRTARGADTDMDAVASARPPRRAGLDRYA